MTNDRPVLRSPINAIPDHTNANFQLRDVSGAPIIWIQGAVADLLPTFFAAVPDQPGELVVAGEGLLARLTATQFYLFGRSPTASLPTVATLEAAFRTEQRFAHATDYRAGIAALRLVGPVAPHLLSKICGLDFASSAFPNLHVAQTNAAKIKTLIAREDEGTTPGYYLHVDAPSGQYFCETVLDAGREFATG